MLNFSPKSRDAYYKLTVTGQAVLVNKTKTSYQRNIISLKSLNLALIMMNDPIPFIFLISSVNYYYFDIVTRLSIYLPCSVIKKY